MIFTLSYSYDAIEECFTSVSNGKSAIASAITDKGVSTASDATFSTMATNIRAITDTDIYSNYIWDKRQGSYTWTTTALSFPGEETITPETSYMPSYTIQIGTSINVNGGKFVVGGSVRTETFTGYGSSTYVYAGEYFVKPSDATIAYRATGTTYCSIVYDGNYYTGKYYLLFSYHTSGGTASKLHDIVSRTTHVAFVNSKNSSAYPPSTPDGYQYTSMGRLDTILNSLIS